MCSLIRFDSIWHHTTVLLLTSAETKLHRQNVSQLKQQKLCQILRKIGGDGNSVDYGPMLFLYWWCTSTIPTNTYCVCMDKNLGLTHWATGLYGGLDRKHKYIVKIIFFKSSRIIIHYLPKIEGHRWQQWEKANHLGWIQISTHAIQAAYRPNDLNNTIHCDFLCNVSNKLKAKKWLSD